MEVYLWLVAALLTIEVIIVPTLHIKARMEMTKNRMVMVGISLIVIAGLIVVVFGYGQGRPYDVAHSDIVYALVTVAVFNMVMPYVVLSCELVTDPALKK